MIISDNMNDPRVLIPLDIDIFISKIRSISGSKETEIEIVSTRIHKDDKEVGEREVGEREVGGDWDNLSEAKNDPNVVDVDSKESRAIAYLDKCDPAVSGNKGSSVFFRIACTVGPGFDLSIEDTIRILTERYNHRCIPPWTEKEISKKVFDAFSSEIGRGWKLEERKSTRDYAEAPSWEEIFDPTQAPKRLTKGGGEVSAVEFSSPKVAVINPDAKFDLDEADNPTRLAILFSSLYDYNGISRIRYWRDCFYIWNGSHYAESLPNDIKSLVVLCVEEEFTRIHAELMDIYNNELNSPGNDKPPKKPRKNKVTVGLISDVMQMIKSITLIAASDIPSMPSWIDLSESDEFVNWPIGDVFALKNRLVRVVGDGDKIESVESTPKYFSTHESSFTYDESAGQPTEWIRFLNDIWPNDNESIEILQEWFGYCLTTDNRYGKSLLIDGPPRSGKGTISHVLRDLVGVSSVASATFEGLKTDHFLSALVGKLAVIIGDAKVDREGIDIAIERILSITGNDLQLINPKYRSPYSTLLYCKFTVCANQSLDLRDSSGALLNRFLMLKLTQSHLGSEDTGLVDRILCELPGIFLWAVEGLRRLNRNQKFSAPPASAEELRSAMRETSSPVMCFIEETLDIGSDFVVNVSAVFEAYKEWCRDKGIIFRGNHNSLGVQLRSAIPSLATIRPTIYDRHRKYRGVKIKDQYLISITEHEEIIMPFDKYGMVIN